MSENKLNCAVLTASMLSAMEADNYSYRIIHRSVNYIYRALNRFCDENYAGIYSPEAGQDFLRFNEKVSLASGRCTPWQDHRWRSHDTSRAYPFPFGTWY